MKKYVSFFILSFVLFKLLFKLAPFPFRDLSQPCDLPTKYFPRNQKTVKKIFYHSFRILWSFILYNGRLKFLNVKYSGKFNHNTDVHYPLYIYLYTETEITPSYCSNINIILTWCKHLQEVWLRDYNTIFKSFKWMENAWCTRGWDDSNIN